MNKPTWKIGEIGRIKTPKDKLKEKKQIRKNTFRMFINKKCKKLTQEEYELLKEVLE